MNSAAKSRLQKRCRNLWASLNGRCWWNCYLYSQSGRLQDENRNPGTHLHHEGLESWLTSTFAEVWFFKVCNTSTSKMSKLLHFDLHMPTSLWECQFLPASNLLLKRAPEGAAVQHHPGMKLSAKPRLQWRCHQVQTFYYWEVSFTFSL